MAVAAASSRSFSAGSRLRQRVSQVASSRGPEGPRDGDGRQDHAVRPAAAIRARSRSSRPLHRSSRIAVGGRPYRWGSREAVAEVLGGRGFAPQARTVRSTTMAPRIRKMTESWTRPAIRSAAPRKTPEKTAREGVGAAATALAAGVASGEVDLFGVGEQGAASGRRTRSGCGRRGEGSPAFFPGRVVDPVPVDEDDRTEDDDEEREVDQPAGHPGESSRIWRPGCAGDSLRSATEPEVSRGPARAARSRRGDARRTLRW